MKRTLEQVREIVVRMANRDEHGCLISHYSLGSHGYPQVQCAPYGNTLAHRVVWIASNGAIPEGMTVDHRCHTKRCVDINHLRLLTNLENARRNMNREGWEPGTGRCVNGHEADQWHPKSATNKKGYCHACRMEAQRRRRRARKEQRLSTDAR